MPTFQKITPNFWFDKEAEDAAKYYTSIFKNSSIGKITHYTDEGQDITKMTPGSVMTVEFQIEGQQFVGLNGGPLFKFNESISFVIDCADQEEVDYYWNKLTAGGDVNAQQCGWLKDKFGVSWQVVPKQLNELLKDKNEAKVKAVTKAMLQMKKLDVKGLEDAFASA